MTEATAAADFRADTALERGGGSSWSGSISPEWSGPPGPNGGYVAALILRAIRAQVAAPRRLPRSLTVHYLRPPAIGEVEIVVDIERSGRTATTATAQLRQGGRTMCIAICVLVDELEGAAQWSAAPPDAAEPGEVEPFDASILPPRIFSQLEMRMCFGAVPFSGADQGLAGGWLRTRAPAPLEPELVAMYSDAWWPAPFPLVDGPFLAPTLELTVHFRGAPPPGDREQVLCRFVSRTGAEGFFEEDGELWSGDGRLLAQSRQLALVRPMPGAAGG